MKATHVTRSTLLGFNNCFSVATVDGEYRIVNFYLETLEKILRKKSVSYPIEITPLNSKIAIISDVRLLDNATPRYCQICCPRDFWPQEQRQEFEAKVTSGEIKITKFDDGWEVVSQRYESRQEPLNYSYRKVADVVMTTGDLL